MKRFDPGDSVLFSSLGESRTEILTASFSCGRVLTGQHLVSPRGRRVSALLLLLFCTRSAVRQRKQRAAVQIYVYLNRCSGQQVKLLQFTQEAPWKTWILRGWDSFSNLTLLRVCRAACFFLFNIHLHGFTWAVVLLHHCANQEPHPSRSKQRKPEQRIWKTCDLFWRLT